MEKRGGKIMKCTFEGYEGDCDLPERGYSQPCTDCPTKEKAQLFIDEPESKKKLKWARTQLEILAAAGIPIIRR